MTSQPKAQSIPEILQQYLEDIGSLWSHRQAALRSPDYTAADLAELGRRIEAPLDGLLVEGEAAIPILQAALGGDDPEIVFAAASALLRLDAEEAAEHVVDALLASEGDAMVGIVQALSHGPIQMIEGQLRVAVESAAPPVAVAAAEALAFHGKWKSEREQISGFCSHEDPQVRRAAWRLVAVPA